MKFASFALFQEVTAKANVCGMRSNRAHTFRRRARPIVCNTALTWACWRPLERFIATSTRAQKLMREQEQHTILVSALAAVEERIGIVKVIIPFYVEGKALQIVNSQRIGTQLI